ncbi:MAG: hypothetical protein ABR956_01145 [Terracidiphilus sp.]|jgi:hypothetical protein
MMLHVASMAAVFVDQVTQAPIQIQCVQQAAPESWVKWLLPTIVQTVVSLLSIFAGVAIAVRSFRANRTTEHEQWIRNEKAGHHRWLREQKKAEWREVLDAIKECQDSLPLVSLLEDGTPVSKDVLPAYHRVRKLQQILYDRLFIDQTTIAPLMSAFLDVSEQSKKAMAGEGFKYAIAYAAFVDKARKAAIKDLGVGGLNDTEANT